MDRKTRLENNKIVGKMGEEAFENEQFWKGNKTKRTGRGSDFEVEEDGDRYLAEVKTGASKLSKRQKQEMRKSKGSYKVPRYDYPLEEYPF